MDEADAPFSIWNADGAAPFVLVVDHASNHVPARWNDLGLDAEALTAHIAWDPGALPVARRMAERLDAPLIHGTVSRLVLDLNRPLRSATLIPPIGETTVVPGNADVSDEDRAHRIRTVYEPYHAALGALVERAAARAAAAGGTLAVVAVHTFTPVFKGVARPMQVGILFDRDRRLADPMLAHLSTLPGVTAAANAPYAPVDEVYFTLDTHAVSRGLKNVMIEIRNDEVRTEEAQTLWADRLVDAMTRKPGGRDGL